MTRIATDRSDIPRNNADKGHGLTKVHRTLNEQSDEDASQTDPTFGWLHDDPREFDLTLSAINPHLAVGDGPLPRRNT